MTRSPWVWFAVRFAHCWKWALLGVLMIGATSTLWQCDPLILKWLVDIVLPGRQWNMVVYAAMLILLVHCCRLTTLSWSLYASVKCGQQLAAVLRRETFHKIGDLDVESVEGSRAGEVVYCLEQDIDQITILGSEILPTLTRITLTATLSVVMMWRLDARLTMVACANVPASIALAWCSRKTLKRYAERSRLAAEQRSAFSSEAVTASVQIRMLQAFYRICQLYDIHIQESIDTTIAERKKQIFFAMASLFVVVIASTLMLGVGGVRVIHGGLTVGSYVAFYAYLLRLFDPLNSAVDLFARLQRNGVSMYRLQTLTEPTETSGQAVTATGSLTVRENMADKDLQKPQSVVCSDLSFSYANGHVAFRDISFSVQQGDRLLLSGPTGAGKSTLLKVISGVYPNYQGLILIDSVDYRNCPSSRIALCGLASQHPVLVSGSLRENLLLGSPNATSSEIDEALYRCCADSLVAQLPNSLNYKVTQSGAGLSGGERQRIALARIILQKRPILLMDEALTGLDNETKTELLSRLRDYVAKRITIVASHDEICKSWANGSLALRSGRLTVAAMAESEQSAHMVRERVFRSLV